MRYAIAICSTVLAISCVTSAALADVYKYKDERGNVLYTDKPNTLPAERLAVQSQRSDTTAVQQRAAEQKRQQEVTKPSNPSANQQQAAELNAKDKAERCAKARQRYDLYVTSQRLFEEQPNGERRYLTDDELDKARASAKTTMETFCK